MNIYEALEFGNGKATLLEYASFWVEKSPRTGNIIWAEEEVTREDLKRNDWIPYVPREIPPVCGNCGQKLPPVKTKHREVFENVVWIDDNSRISSSDVYPHCLGNSRAFKPFKNKKCTKVTVEWEQ